MSETRLVVPSLAVASEEELSRVDAETAREKEWYKDHERFSTSEDIFKAVYDGRLRFVHPDKNIELIGRMRNPALYDQFSPYLLPNALHAQKLIGQLWRKDLEKKGLYLPGAPIKDTRLAATSYTRSELKQGDILGDPTKLASKDSTHTAGGAFDIDASAYYVFTKDGLISVCHPKRPKAKIQEIGQFIMDNVDEGERYVSPKSNTPYNTVIVETLLGVAERLHKLGLINLFLEYKEPNNEYNRCAHIAVNPDVDFSSFDTHMFANLTD